MILGVTIARRHDETAFAVLIDPSVPIGEQIAEFRRMKVTGTHEEFAEVKVLSSLEGECRRMKFRKPAPATEPEPELKPEDLEQIFAAEAAKAEAAKAAKAAKAAEAKAAAEKAAAQAAAEKAARKAAREAAQAKKAADAAGNSSEGDTSANKDQAGE